MVLTDASRSCHDSSPRPIEASSAVADDGEQRRTSVSGSRWWPLPFTRCVSLPKQDLQNLSGFLPYQLEETVAPQPRAHFAAARPRLAHGNDFQRSAQRR